MESKVAAAPAPTPASAPPPAASHVPTSRPATAPPRAEWVTPKTAPVIPRLLSKQSRRVTGSEPPTPQMRSVNYNILAPPPPEPTARPKTGLARVQHRDRSEEVSFTSSLASARGRSKSDFMRSSVPLEHPLDTKSAAPTSTSTSTRNGAATRESATSSLSLSFRGNGGDISSPRGGKRIVQREERREKPQASKGMVVGKHAHRSHLNSMSGLAGGDSSDHRDHASSALVARETPRGLGAGTGRSAEAFAASSVGYNILAPPSAGPAGPKPSLNYAFIRGLHGTHAAGVGSKK